MNGHEILAIDQGTTNTKVVLVNGDGQVVARKSRAVEATFPHAGWVEQDATALWQSVRDTVEELLRERPARPRAVAVTNQRESVVLWERATGRPLGPVVSWQCRRTTPACEALRAAGLGPSIEQRSGLGLDPLFSATKARWLLDRVDDGRRRAERGELCLGTVDSWLLWRLTGGEIHATDVTNASRTQLLDIETLTWSPELLDVFGIPLAALPVVRPSSGPFGATIQLGPLAAGTPIAAVAGDSHAALCGHGGLRPGVVKATYGTGSSLMTATDRLVRPTRGLCPTVAWARDAAVYALEGNISVAGGALDWLAGLLGVQGGAAIADLAAQVPDAGGVALVPAFVGLGAPHWDAEARGLVAGITRGTTAAHLARAAVEGIVLQVCDVLHAMEGDAGVRFTALLADGGASRSDLLMQLQADLSGRAVVRDGSPDAAARGVAYLAGLETKLWRTVDEVVALPRTGQRFEPRISNGERYDRQQAWRAAVDRARTPATRATPSYAFRPATAGWPI